MAAGGAHATDSVQIALVHLLFNIIGIALFYPIPFMRWPISLAQVTYYMETFYVILTCLYLQSLGDTTAKYRWFALVYLFGMFIVFPGIIFLLSLAGTIVIYVVFIPIAALLLLVILVNLLQRRKPTLLPSTLQTWGFLPLLVRSLEPYDRLVISCLARYDIKKKVYFCLIPFIKIMPCILYVRFVNDNMLGAGGGGTGRVTLPARGGREIYIYIYV